MTVVDFHEKREGNSATGTGKAADSSLMDVQSNNGYDSFWNLHHPCVASVSASDVELQRPLWGSHYFCSRRPSAQCGACDPFSRSI